MAKFEKEIKVLDIDADEMKEKLKKIGAEDKGEKEQKIYVYDIPTLYYRFLEIKELLKSDSPLLINTNMKKLKTLIIEYKDLMEEKELKSIETILNLDDIEDLLLKDVKDIINVLDNETLKNSFERFKINPNKWIRLRQSNDTVLLTSKHIFEKNTSDFQSVLETEFEVSSLEEANLFLESIGISKRSYQEKKRHSYVYKGAEIEIDIWPLLNPYLEIECDDETIIDELIKKLELDKYEIVSLNTEQLYKKIGIDVHSMSELKF